MLGVSSFRPADSPDLHAVQISPSKVCTVRFRLGTFRNYSCQGPEHTSYHTPPCMHTRTHTHAHVHMQHTCTHTPMPSHVRTHTCTHARMHTYMHTPPCTHTGAHIPMHTCTHAHAAHVHSHTHVSVLESSGSNPPLCMCGI